LLGADNIVGFYWVV